MSITSHHRMPAPRPRATGAPAFTPLTGDELRSAAYQEFMYGFGIVPGLELGRPLGYRKADGVFRHDFELGVTLANVGPRNVEIPLEHPHLDADGRLRLRVSLAPRTSEVLRRV